MYVGRSCGECNPDFALVSFQDNAVGTGTGKYKDRQLFRARQNHASLVPILGLMKEAEFYQSANPPQNHSEYSINFNMNRTGELIA